jgi:hypothetical protein
MTSATLIAPAEESRFSVSSDSDMERALRALSYVTDRDGFTARAVPRASWEAAGGRRRQLRRGR